MRILIGGIFVLAVATVFADPVAIGTKSEVQAARGLIEDLVQSETSADELLTMANESTKGAERFWLYWNAFILRAKDGKFAEATDIIKSLRANVTGVPDADIVSLIERNARKGLTESAELAAILKESKIRVAAQKLVAQLKKDVQKNPKDDGLKVTLAEALAVGGDWDAALKTYAETKLASATVAKLELANKKSAKIAAFWWDYKPCQALLATTAFKAHAVEIYTELTKDGGLSALEKALAEKRISQISEVAVVDKSETPVFEELQAKKEDDQYVALKEVCNIKGLLHCWRFNGDLKDCVGGGLAILNGNAVLENRQVNFRSGFNNIDLGSGYFSGDCSAATIEIWVKAQSFPSSRIFVIGKNKGNRVSSSWSFGRDDSLGVVKDGKTIAKLSPAFGPFIPDVEYHLSLVMSKHSSGSWDFVAYCKDCKTGTTLAKRNMTVPNTWNFDVGEPNNFWLGRSYYDDATPDASYNEVRIWNRALDEKELTQNAIRFHKAGETMKPNK